MQEFGPFFGLFTFPQVGQDWNSQFRRIYNRAPESLYQRTLLSPYLGPASKILLSTS
jgi:hypothetical protein